MELPYLAVPKEVSSQTREPKRKRKNQSQNSNQTNNKSRDSASPPPLRRSARLQTRQEEKKQRAYQNHSVALVPIPEQRQSKHNTEVVDPDTSRETRKRNRSVSSLTVVQPPTKKSRQDKTKNKLSVVVGVDSESESETIVCRKESCKPKKRRNKKGINLDPLSESDIEINLKVVEGRDISIRSGQVKKQKDWSIEGSPDRKSKLKRGGAKGKGKAHCSSSKHIAQQKTTAIIVRSESSSVREKRTLKHSSDSDHSDRKSKPATKSQQHSNECNSPRSRRNQKKGKATKWTYPNHLSLPQFAQLTSMATDKSKDPLPPGGDDSNDAESANAGGPSSSERDPGSSLDSLAEETRQLQAMLEARGLPPHLLGSLGSKMHYILHNKSISSSNNSRAQQLLAGIENIGDDGVQLQSCIEMGQLLVMGNEETVSGFPVKQAVPALINLLSMEHNFDMMLNACRALTYMMEALPRSTSVVANAIPVLVEKLQVIQCMDVAEQALLALELLSRRHGKAVLLAGGLNACLLYLDFFSIAPQRNALSTAANCCQCVTEDDVPCVMAALPILEARLQHQDKPSVESCCLCFSRLVDNLSQNPTILKNIASHNLLSNLQQLLVISPPVISLGVFGIVVRMLSHLCASCPFLAVDLLKLNIAETLRFLLIGPGELSLDNIELVSRSPNEVYEILSLAGELMPPLPIDGVFRIEELLNTKRVTHNTVQWEWLGNQNVWRSYGKMENRIIEATHQTNEEECNIAVMGNVYIIDLSTMQQINEATGTSRSIRRTVADAEVRPSEPKAPAKIEDARLVVLRENPSIGKCFVQALFGSLYEVFDSTAGPSVRNKCLQTLLRIIYHAHAEILLDILKDISVSSHLATMLKAQDYRVIIGGIQMAHILMQKLPDIFIEYFHREGVFYQLKNLRDNPLKVLVTSKQEVATPPSVPPPPAPADSTQRTPSSTRKRLSDIFRKGKRQLRRTLRSRTEEEERGPSTSTLPPQTGKIFSESRPSPNDSAVPMISTPGPKERLQEWIREQSASFLEKWVASDDSNPAFEVVKKLREATQKLDPKSPSCLLALTSLHSILVDTASNVSAFEFVHHKTHVKLMRYLTVDLPDSSVPLNIRLRHFLHTFMGLPEHNASLDSWSPSAHSGVSILLQKIHICVNQLEQLPVKVHDMPGRRGSQALRFFNTHQIKCVLECHSSAVGSSQWKGGPLRIDPLATIQTLERYMMIRGFGRQGGSRRQEDLESEDSEIDEGYLMTVGAPGQSPDKHIVEFLIGSNNTVLPYSMTIFEAIKQFALSGLHLDSEEEMGPLGRPEIWIKTHTIHYRPIVSADSTSVGPSTAHGGFITRSHSASLPTNPPEPSSSSTRKHTWSSGVGVTSFHRRPGPDKTPVSIGTEGTPITSRVAPRATKKSPGPSPTLSPNLSWSQSESGLKALTVHTQVTDEVVKEKERKSRWLPLHNALQKSVDLNRELDDPSAAVLCLLKAIYALNTNWTDLYPGLAGSPIVPGNEFISSKLTAKATRQLQDPLNVMITNLPSWVRGLTTNCPFLFPFECRQTLFYLTAFDRDRALARLHEQYPDLSSASDTQSTAAPRLDKKKYCVTRDNLLEQAEKLMNELASSKAVLEIHYQDEVGTGLGPTLEFYTLVSRELLRSDLLLWRGDLCPIPGVPQGASSVSQYIYSSVGVFPAPLGPSTKFTVVEEICSRFRFLGKLMAKAMLDSRMLDIPLSEAFYKWMLGLESTFTARDLQHVDPVVARSFAQLASVAVKKHSLESDPLLSGKALAIGIGSLELDGGGTIEDLDLDFTLPGYPDIELKPGGRDLTVTIHNLDEYLKLVVDWTLMRGVARQMEAFKDGFSSIFPISCVQGLFYPSEMDTLICGAHLQKWDIKELMESCRPDHGYSHDSRAVQMLFEVLSTYDTAEQRMFIQFVTGSPRLPVGGFKSLSPPMTIVRKTVDASQSLDNFLPSVMTCVNYLKLPDYSSVKVLREKLHFAFIEGKHSFHLS